MHIMNAALGCRQQFFLNPKPDTRRDFLKEHAWYRRVNARDFRFSSSIGGKRARDVISALARICSLLLGQSGSLVGHSVIDM